MRRLVILSAVVLVVAIARAKCLWLPNRVHIADASKPARVMLEARTHPDRIYALDVVGSGHLDGGGKIWLVLNGEPYKTIELRGPVHFSWGGDWYSPEAEVRYSPDAATTGSISLSYEFHSL